MKAIDTWSRWRIFSSSYKSYKWKRLTLDQGEGYSLPLISLTNESDWHLILHLDQVSIVVICKIYKRMRISFTLIKCQSLSCVSFIRGREYPSPWSSVNRFHRVFSSSYKSYKWQRLTLDHGKGYSRPLISLKNNSDWHLIKVKGILIPIVRLIRGWQYPSPWSSVNRKTYKRMTIPFTMIKCQLV
jgi:hypothetical protein